MKKKLVSILLCATMVAGLAVGCGGKKEEGGDKGGDKLVYLSLIHISAVKTVLTK